MDWLFGRWRQVRRDRPALVCYLRENGPIAYATGLFTRETRERAEAMLSIGLTWYWKTSSSPAAGRDWTELSRWSLAALLGDLAAPQSAAVPQVLVIAIDPPDSAEEITDTRVATWMRGFCAAAPGPLHAVVSHPAPGGDLVFVAQQPPEPIRLLLQDWGIDRDRATRRAYPRLHGSTLEDLIQAMGRRTPPSREGD